MTSPLRLVAYERFKSRLFDRTLSPGAFITQRELCELLDSPMGAVREALKRLEVEGMIHLLPQRGVQIADINLRFINEAFHFRLLIEQEAVRRMASAPDLPLLRELKSRTTGILDRIAAQQSVDEALLAEGLRVDLDLHVKLVANLGNSLIRDTYQSIEDRVRLIRLNSTYQSTQLARGMTEHLQIIDALLAGDQTESVAALKAHLTTSWRRALGNDEIDQ